MNNDNSDTNAELGEEFVPVTKGTIIWFDNNVSSIKKNETISMKPAKAKSKTNVSFAMFAFFVISATDYFFFKLLGIIGGTISFFVLCTYFFDEAEIMPDDDPRFFRITRPDLDIDNYIL